MVPVVTSLSSTARTWCLRESCGYSSAFASVSGGRLPTISAFGSRSRVATAEPVVENLRAEPTEFIDAGEHVVVPFRLSGRARNTRLPFHEDYIHVLTFRGERVVRTRLFRSRAKALEAAGLRE
jgi:ketosteroid isomerase-like protein